MKQIAVAAALGGAMLVGGGYTASPARAAFIVTLVQQSGDVVATGSGTIDLAALGSPVQLATLAFVNPRSGATAAGPTVFTPADLFAGVTGAASFGAGGETGADTGSGDIVGIDDLDGFVVVPAGYVSGDKLSDSATYNNQSFAGLGVIPGTYVWHWGSGPNADSFTLDIVAPVPEPSAALLLALALGVAGIFVARRRA